MWDLETLQCVKTLKTTGGKSIYSLAVAGNYLLSATYDNSVFVWSLKDLELLKTLHEHQACVLSLSVSGKWFFSGSYDTTVKVWSLETLQCVDTLHHKVRVDLERRQMKKRTERGLNQAD